MSDKLLKTRIMYEGCDPNRVFDTPLKARMDIAVEKLQKVFYKEFDFGMTKYDFFITEADIVSKRDLVMAILKDI